MSNQEKLDIIEANYGCWLYSKDYVIWNTFSFLNFCKDRKNFTLQADKYVKNSCSTYFYNYRNWYIKDDSHFDASSTYSRFDNSDEERILNHLDDVVLIESNTHTVLWSEKEVDGKLLIGRFLMSEDNLREILTQQSLFNDQFGDEPTSIRLKGRLYSAQELESILEQLDSLKAILNR